MMGTVRFSVRSNTNQPISRQPTTEIIYPTSMWSYFHLDDKAETRNRRQHQVKKIRNPSKGGRRYTPSFQYFSATSL